MPEVTTIRYTAQSQTCRLLHEVPGLDANRDWLEEWSKNTHDKAMGAARYFVDGRGTEAFEQSERRSRYLEWEARRDADAPPWMRQHTAMMVTLGMCRDRQVYDGMANALRGKS